MQRVSGKVSTLDLKKKDREKIMIFSLSLEIVMTGCDGRNFSSHDDSYIRLSPLRTNLTT